MILKANSLSIMNCWSGNSAFYCLLSKPLSSSWSRVLPKSNNWSCSWMFSKPLSCSWSKLFVQYKSLHNELSYWPWYWPKAWFKSWLKSWSWSRNWSKRIWNPQWIYFQALEHGQGLLIILTCSPHQKCGVMIGLHQGCFLHLMFTVVFNTIVFVLGIGLP